MDEEERINRREAGLTEAEEDKRKAGRWLMVGCIALIIVQFWVFVVLLGWVWWLSFLSAWVVPLIIGTVADHMINSRYKRRVREVRTEFDFPSPSDP